MGTIYDFFRRFRAASDANVAMLLALSIIPLIAVAGFAIDYSRMLSAQKRLSLLLDQAVLASANLNSQEDPKDLITSWLETQLIDEGVSASDITLDVDANLTSSSREVAATASLNVDLLLMPVVGQHIGTVTAEAKAVQYLADIEIALALDVSSSMRGSRIANLKKAATGFIDLVLTDGSKSSTSISLIPYGGSVNVGRDLFERYAVEVSDSFTQLNPSKAQYNNSAKVEAGAFRFSDGNYCIENTRADYNEKDLPVNSRGQVANFWVWWNNHPWCPEQESSVLLNTNNAAALKAHINGMTLSDGTASQQGAMWALKALSPDLRGALAGDFPNRPLDFGRTDVKKVLIIMTDGRISDQFRPQDPSIGSIHTNVTNKAPNTDANNQYRKGNKRNRQKILSRGTASNSASSESGSGRFKRVCDQANKLGMDVYTIGFQIKRGSDPDKLLAYCASTPLNYFFVEGLNLEATFQSIAAEISDLRLSQ